MSTMPYISVTLRRMCWPPVSYFSVTISITITIPASLFISRQLELVLECVGGSLTSSPLWLTLSYRKSPSLSLCMFQTEMGMGMGMVIVMQTKNIIGFHIFLRSSTVKMGMLYRLHHLHSHQGHRRKSLSMLISPIHLWNFGNKLMIYSSRYTIPIPIPIPVPIPIMYI